MTVLVRRDVYALDGPWHPVLRAYALAIGKMRALPASDHRSLAYQASVHGVGLESDPPPDAFRSQCQHNCWYFIPWHRWYLHYFEQIIRSLLKDIDEVPDDVAEAWALPYWDYGRNDTDRLPFEFSRPRLWDDQRANPLFDGTRYGNVNGRTAAVDRLVSVPLPGVLDQPFSSPHDNVPTFGGTESGWHHFKEPGAVAGGLESSPHNAVHGFVGGNMLSFATAGLDPVFWLHHCNIDRYWEIKGHAGDPAGTWADEFSFRDAGGALEKVKADGCVDAENQLGYRYEDVTRPGPPTPGLAIRAGATEEVAMAEPPDLPPEVIGTAGAIELEGTSQRVQLEAGPVSQEFRDARGGVDEPARVYLAVTEIRGRDDPGLSYAVYLDEVDDEHLAGIVSFFGIRGTTEGAHGLGYSFDVTDIVRASRGAGAWDPSRVEVLFEPIGTDAIGGPEALADVPRVEIGSVSLLAQ